MSYFKDVGVNSSKNKDGSKTVRSAFGGSQSQLPDGTRIPNGRSVCTSCGGKKTKSLGSNCMSCGGIGYK